MNFGIEQLATYQTLVFCIGVYAILFILRKVLEGVFRKQDLANRYYWREVLLPVLPSLIGMGMGIGMKFFPFPEGFTHWGQRALYGLVCGFASALVYKIAISIVRKQWPGTLPSIPGDESPLP